MSEGHIDMFVSTCEDLRVPLAKHKRKGPTTQLVFLGIELDSISGHLMPPVQKPAR